MENDNSSTDPAKPMAEDKEQSYSEWLAADIAAGIAELDAGEGVPLDEVMREFGLK